MTLSITKYIWDRFLFMLGCFQLGQIVGSVINWILSRSQT